MNSPIKPCEKTLLEIYNKASQAPQDFPIWKEPHERGLEAVATHARANDPEKEEMGKRARALLDYLKNYLLYVQEKREFIDLQDSVIAYESSKKGLQNE